MSRTVQLFSFVRSLHWANEASSKHFIWSSKTLKNQRNFGSIVYLYTQYALPMTEDDSIGFFDCLFHFCSNFEFAFIIFQKYWRIFLTTTLIYLSHRFVSEAGAASAEQCACINRTHAEYRTLVLLCISNTFSVFVILFLFSYHHSRAIFSTHYYVFEFFFFFLIFFI